ncbi:MAG: cupin-like domain-containing protein [Planctomycetota bacterium]
MTERLFLDATWKKWVAENALRGRNPADIVRVLTANGFPSDHARLEVDTAFNHPYLAAAFSLSRKLAKRDWLLQNSRVVHEMHEPQLAECSDEVSQTEFLSHFYANNRAVVIRGGCKEMDAVKNWSPAYLCSIAGNRLVHAGSGAENAELLPNKFSDFTRLWSSKDSQERIHLRADSNESNSTLFAALLPDIQPVPDMLDESEMDKKTWIWMGTRDCVTPLQHDLVSKLILQIRGTRHFKLVAPEYLPFLYNDHHCHSRVDPENVDLSLFPLFGQVRVIDVTVTAGDVIFVPVGWWYHIRSLEPAIAVTMTSFAAPNHFANKYPTYGSI